MSEGTFNLKFQLTRPKIEEICKSISDSKKVSEIIPKNAGLSAYIVKVNFMDTSEPSWMIRVVNPEYKMGFEREIGAILHAKDKIKVPTPKIVKIDSTRNIIPESYYIYEYLEGDTLGHQIEYLPFDKKETIYADLGHILAKMHLDQNNKAGPLLYVDGKFKFEPWDLKNSLEEEMYLGQAEDFQWALDHAFKEKYSELYQDCEQIWNDYKNSIRNNSSPSDFAIMTYLRIT